MNYNLFFEKASEEGIDALEISIVKSKKLSFGFFRNEIQSYTVSDSFKLSARGFIRENSVRRPAKKSTRRPSGS